MRFILSILTLVSLSSASFAGTHVNANNCEIFIDRIMVSTSSQGSATILPYIKILPFRLNGQVEEVGFRNTSETFSYQNHSSSTRPWSNALFFNTSSSRDYWAPSWSYMVSSEYGRTTFTGSFYVRTSSGTTYWAKNAHGGDFVFDINAFNILSNFGNRGDGYEATINTQRSDMRYYNPKNCY